MVDSGNGDHDPPLYRASAKVVREGEGSDPLMANTCDLGGG